MQSAVRGLTRKMIKVIPIRALDDNYMYLVYSEKDSKGFAVDPVEPQKVKAVAENCPALTILLIRRHILCYYVTHPDSDSRIVLTGDTLFIAGCGEELLPRCIATLNEVLAKLPDDTLVYPGHEYTYSNLKFAQHIEPSNENVKRKLEWAARCRERNEPTVPSTIAEEKEINPFMRTSSPEIQKKVGATDLIDVMARVRQAKNSFRGLKVDYFDIL
ncbi:putative hydroxyacylglutathione hydrolase [Ostertagia ostertagi]